MSCGVVNLVAGPSAEPVSLTEAKLYCRVDQGLEDVLFDLWIREARERAERATGKPLLLQTWALTLDRFPATQDGGIELPRSYPLVSVVGVSYRDADGDTLTVDAANYRLDTARRPGWVYPVSPFAWPGVYEPAWGEVTVAYTAGTANLTAAGLAELRSRVLTAVAYCHRNREARDEGWLDSLFGSLWNGRL